MIEWSWRVENETAISFGSFSENETIDDEVPRLVGASIIDVSLFGRLPEIVIALDNKKWIQSFATQGGQPEWSLFLNDGSWCYVENGRVHQEDETGAERIKIDCAEPQSHRVVEQARGSTVNRR